MLWDISLVHRSSLAQCMDTIIIIEVSHTLIKKGSQYSRVCQKMRFFFQRTQRSSRLRGLMDDEMARSERAIWPLSFFQCTVHCSCTESELGLENCITTNKYSDRRISCTESLHMLKAIHFTSCKKQIKNKLTFPRAFFIFSIMKINSEVIHWRVILSIKSNRMQRARKDENEPIDNWTFGPSEDCGGHLWYFWVTGLSFMIFTCLWVSTQ